MFFYTQPIYLCIYLVTEHLIYKKHAKAIINHTFVTRQLPQQLSEGPQTSCWVWVFPEQPHQEGWRRHLSVSESSGEETKRKTKNQHSRGWSFLGRMQLCGWERKVNQRQAVRPGFSVYQNRSG